jgi:glycosyltransferase involved in cell wall biosynthesis
MSAPLSVLVLTKNEERNIGACLDSLVGWASDVVVLDSGSTDGTLAACAARGVPTIFHPYTDHVSQIRWALMSIPWKHDWFMLIDADYVVTEALQNEIAQMLGADPQDVHGCYTGHRRYFRNRRVRAIRAHRLLLVRRSRAHVEQSELVDARFVVDGRTAVLHGCLVENNQNELDIDFWIDKHQKYARRFAIEQILRTEQILAWSDNLQPRLFGTPHERIIWLKNVWYRMPLYVRPVFLFVYQYVIRGGFLDGWNGFVFHALQDFWFRLMVDIHIADYRRQLERHTLSLEQLIEAAGTLPAATMHRARS